MVRVDLELNRKQSYFSFPRWNWPVPGPYNASSGFERIRGWQITFFLSRNGWLPSPTICSVTGSSESVVWHTERCLTPWNPLPVSRGTRVQIHQRFRRPASWRRFLDENALPACWAFELSCNALRVTARTADDYTRSIVGAGVIPNWVLVPWRELFRDDEHPALSAEMTEEEMARFIASNEWTFARTLSHIPHEYVVRHRCSSEWDFDRFVVRIRKLGVSRRFGHGKYVYLDFEGWSYFTLGATLSATTVLNRARMGAE